MKEIGEFADTPVPDAGCPANCQAIGHVTGYQVQIGTHKNPYLIAQPGKIVAFTMKLGKPDAQQTQFFTNLFGGAPQARLTILKKPKKDKPKTNDLTLTQQSGVWNLSSYLGSTPTFTLGKPLHVYPGAIVAITVPTWAPAFAINLGADQAWRSARPKNDCNGTSQVAQQTAGTTTSYDCFYRTARLLYTVTFIPDPKPTAAAK
ncbi:MAG: hypothetical protein QOC95_1757 [Thermoleophilaceae bacterium]|nr:hypothetical protein [Thermoleophilaceae bacterium]